MMKISNYSDRLRIHEHICNQSEPRKLTHFFWIRFARIWSNRISGRKQKTNALFCDFNLFVKNWFKNRLVLQEHADFEVIRSMDQQLDKCITRINVFRRHRQIIQVHNTTIYIRVPSGIIIFHWSTFTPTKQWSWSRQSLQSSMKRLQFRSHWSKSLYRVGKLINCVYDLWWP